MCAKSLNQMIGLLLIGVWQVGGCTGGLGALLPERAIDFDLGSELGEFEVQGGAPVEKTGRLQFETGGVRIGRGSLEIDPGVVTLEVADTADNKGRVALQANENLAITVWIASAAELDDVFDVGDQYGPYELTLDENAIPIAISPATVSLTQGTLDLLNDGEFSIGLRIESPIDGIVTIESLTFNVGL